MKSKGITNLKTSPLSKIIHTSGFHLLGLLVSLSMPVAAILVELIAGSVEFSIPAVVDIQVSQPLVWLAEFFAVLLAIFFIFNIQAENKRAQNEWQISDQLREKNSELFRLKEKSQKDLSERFQVEAVMSRAKREWEATFDAISDPIVVTDDSEKIVRCNNAATRVFEKTYQEIIGMEINEVCPGIVSPIQENDSIPSQIFMIPSVQGLYDLSGFPIQLSDNQCGFIYIFRDISQRKHAETEMLRQKQYFEAIFQNDPIAIISLDMNGHIVTSNPGFERLFGYSQLEAIGRKLDDLVTPVEYREQAMEFSRRVRRGEVVHELSRRTTKSGGLLDVDTFNIPVSVEGESQGILVLFHNITELVQSRRKAEEADREKNEYFANMSREIRTPLNSVIGMLNLTMDTPLTPEQSSYLAAALDNAEALMGLINNILDMSKIETGRLELETTDMNLRAVVEDAAASLAQHPDYNGQELVSIIPPDVPVLLQGDPGRLQQVLVNLAGNAMKSTEKGEVVLRVKKVTETIHSATIAFFVQDTGKAIPAERQSEMSTVQKYGHTGLGLTISAQLVELMGGKITAISEPNTGCTFSFAATFPKQENAPHSDIRQEALFKDLRVLVVDPGINCRTNLAQLLDTMGCRVASAPSTARAWRLLEEAVRANKPFHVMMIDGRLVLSRTDALLQHIRNTPRISSVKILLLNMIGQPLSRSDCETIGCAGYLQKPIRLDSLQEALSGILSPNGFSSPDAPSARQKPADVEESHSQKQQRVLLVEDNPINSKIILTRLQQFGHLTDLVENGQQAVDAYEKNHYDLILMDTQMPVMDGFEASKKIRALDGEHRVPIIAMTAQVLPGEIERCKECGMDDTISKPIKTHELYDKIERWGDPANPGTSPVGVEEPPTRSDDLLQNLRSISGSAGLQAKNNRQQGSVSSDNNLATDFDPPVSETWLEANARVNPGSKEPVRQFKDRRTKPLGDPEYIESILPRFGNDHKFFISMFEDYIRQCREKVQDLEQAVQSNDALTVQHLAHNLKGLAANFESIQIAALAGEMDMQAARGDLGQAKALIEAFQQEIPELDRKLAEIKAFLPDDAS